MGSYNFTSDWFSEYAPDWIKAMLSCGIEIGARRNILELGSFEGRSACWMSDNLLDHPDSTLTCVDTFCGTPEFGTMFSAIFTHARSSLHDRFVRNIANSKNARKVRTFITTTEKYLDEIQDDGFQFDLIYVDAGHFEHEAYYDGLASYNVLRPGGILVFDDYLWAPHFGFPVKTAVNRLEKELPMRLLHDGWQRIYQKPIQQRLRHDQRNLAFG